jgi:hypothetical protein
MAGLDPAIEENQRPGAIPAFFLAVIASGAKQSIVRHNGWMDCFVALLLAMTLRERDPYSAACAAPSAG